MAEFRRNLPQLLVAQSGVRRRHPDGPVTRLMDTLDSLSEAEQQLRHAQQQLNAVRQRAQTELLNCEQIASTFAAQNGQRGPALRQRRGHRRGAEEVQRLRSSVEAVRLRLGSSTAKVPRVLYKGSGLGRSTGSGGALCTALHAVQARLDACDAEGKAVAEVHNEGRCLILRVLAMAGVREAVLQHVELRQLGRDRRICKDFHRWNAEAMSLRVPVIPTYVVAGRLGARVEYRALGYACKGSHEAPDCIAEKISQIQHSNRGAFASFWDAHREQIFFAGYRDSTSAEDNTFVKLHLRTGVWTELPPLNMAGRIIAGAVLPDDGRLVLLSSVGTVPSLSEGRWHCFDSAASPQAGGAWSVLRAPQLVALEHDPSFFGPVFLGLPGFRIAIFTNDYSAPDGNNVRFYLAEMSAAHPDVPFVFRLRQGPSIAAPNLNTSTKTAVAFPDGRLAFFGYSRLAADDEGPACICTVIETANTASGWHYIELPLTHTTLSYGHAVEGCILFGSYSRCATPEGVLQLRRRLGQGLTKGLPWGRRCSTLQAVDIERATEHQVDVVYWVERRPASLAVASAMSSAASSSEEAAALLIKTRKQQLLAQGVALTRRSVAIDRRQQLSALLTQRGTAAGMAAGMTESAPSQKRASTWRRSAAAALGSQGGASAQRGDERPRTHKALAPALASGKRRRLVAKAEVKPSASDHMGMTKAELKAYGLIEDDASSGASSGGHAAVETSCELGAAALVFDATPCAQNDLARAPAKRRKRKQGTT